MTNRDWWADFLKIIAGGFELDDSWSIAFWTVLTASSLVPVVSVIIAYRAIG